MTLKKRLAITRRVNPIMKSYFSGPSESHIYGEEVFRHRGLLVRGHSCVGTVYRTENLLRQLVDRDVTDKVSGE